MRQQVELKELCFWTAAERKRYEWIKRKRSVELLLCYLINSYRMQSCCLLKKIKLFKLSIKHVLENCEKRIWVSLNVELKWDFLKKKRVCRIFIWRFLHVLWGGRKFWGADFCFLIFILYFDFRRNSQLSTYKLGLHLDFFQFIRRTREMYK